MTAIPEIYDQEKKRFCLNEPMVALDLRPNKAAKYLVAYTDMEIVAIFSLTKWVGSIGSLQ